MALSAFFFGISCGLVLSLAIDIAVDAFRRGGRR